MNYLHVIPYYIRAQKTGGPAILLSNLVQALNSNGHTNNIVSSNGDLTSDINLDLSQNILETYEAGIKTFYFRRDKSVIPATYYYAPNLKAWLHEHVNEYDIVTLHGVWTYFNWVAARICQNKKVPYLIFIHGSLSPWALGYHWIKKIPYWHLIEKKNLLNSAGIIVLSEDEADQVTNMKIDRPTLQVKNGLILPLPKISYAADQLSIHIPELRNYPFFCFISRLHPIKGLEILLNAWVMVKNKFPEWRMVIAGPNEGGYFRQLNEIIQKNNIEESVFFPGLVSGDLKIALLQNAAFFVLPSLSEGMPGAVIEALGYGKPVIITPQCHLPEVERFEAGIIISPTISEVENALLSMMGNPNILKKMGKNAKKLSIEQFNELEIARSFTEFCLPIVHKSL